MTFGSRRQPELGEDARHVPLDGGDGDDQRVCDSPVGATLSHQREHLAVPRSESVDWTALSTSADQPGDDLRVQHGPARSHAPDGVDEARDIADAMLEEVADALGTIGEKLERVMILQELR